MLFWAGRFELQVLYHSVGYNLVLVHGGTRYHTLSLEDYRVKLLYEREHLLFRPYT